jgi:predicted nucleic acid-binding protein
MNADSFLDTNILVYAATCDDSEKAKRNRALELIDTMNFALSAQVLQEFYVTVTRKMEIPLSPKQALQWLEQLEAFPCISVDSNLVKTGVEISIRYQISYWDDAIIAAAEIAGAINLYSEDLGHGLRYGAVTVINPFADCN